MSHFWTQFGPICPNFSISELFAKNVIDTFDYFQSLTSTLKIRNINQSDLNK